MCYPAMSDIGAHFLELGTMQVHGGHILQLRGHVIEMKLAT